MIFEPRPHNDFPRFIDVYYQRCRAACPKVQIIAGKWNFEDLIPGMSDFDSRLIVSNDTTVRDWCEMSLAVGKVHTDLVREQPQWTRLLEHLPGLNLTVAEMTDPVFYYPEFQQWTFHEGKGAALATIRDYLANKPWSRRDELFHLKKFATYFGPYDRKIDPPINLGKFENKYPLHSRFMHYFAPPVQSAVCLVEKQGVGKLHALRSARYLFPNAQVIQMILDVLDRDYETPELYEEPRLTQIERQLEAYLRGVYAVLADHVSLIRIEPADSPAQLKAKVKAIPLDVAERFYEGVKFGRLMKGRLLFFAEIIAWFEAEPLIRLEVGRMMQTLYESPLRMYGLARFGSELSAEETLERVTGELVAHADRDPLRRFTALCAAPIQAGEERQRARDVAEVYEPVLRMTEALGADMRQRLPSC